MYLDVQQQTECIVDIQSNYEYQLGPARLPCGKCNWSRRGLTERHVTDDDNDDDDDDAGLCCKDDVLLLHVNDDALRCRIRSSPLHCHRSKAYTTHTHTPHVAHIRGYTRQLTICKMHVSLNNKVSNVWNR